MVHKKVRQLIQAFKKKPAPFRLTGQVQHYDWGGRGKGAFIPRLLKTAAGRAKPWAELWFGAHPLKPATALLPGGQVPLDRLAKRAPAALCGARVTRNFHGAFPFLLKILDVARTLSIQAHPGAARARAGFLREQRKKIPFNSPLRSYKDPRPKPELLVALTDFYALSRFRPARAAARALTQAGLAEILPRGARRKGEFHKRIFNNIMALPQPRVDRFIKAWLGRLEKKSGRPSFSKNDVRHWAAQTGRLLSRGPRMDRGLFFFPLMNLIHLKPGEGMFLAPGEPHAYLAGTAMEVMANSDNVLRGGLTSKHVDAQELKKVLAFRPGKPAVLKRGRDGAYRTPAREFSLSFLRLTRGKALRARTGGPHLLLTMSGRAILQTWHSAARHSTSSWNGAAPIPFHKQGRSPSGNGGGRAVLSCAAGRLALGPGDAAVVPASVKEYTLEPRTPKATVFRASVPGKSS